jgi:hypothetical protein
MLKALAVLRTIVLVFLVGYTVRAMPLFLNQARTFDESYARCADALSLVLRAAWIAVGWIAIETVIGWILATRKPRTAAAASTPRPGEPPFAPPGRG